jgi:hypothetical protein
LLLTTGECVLLASRSAMEVASIRAAIACTAAAAVARVPRGVCAQVAHALALTGSPTVVARVSIRVQTERIAASAEDCAQEATSASRVFADAPMGVGRA